jgi:acyl phosphate:glycerol-3-phosphate acyltransferase
MWLIVVLLMLSYLMGSLSSAIIVSKVMGLPDPRAEGSKNPGATNMLRLSGKKAAGITLLGDFLKGLIPVLIARALGIDDFFLALVGLLAVLGHVFPLFFNFSGGKGVATAMGVFFALFFYIALAALVAWLAVFWAFRYSSLASLFTMLVVVTLTLLFQINYFLPVAGIALLVVFLHKSNIKRLQEGTEKKTTI